MPEETIWRNVYIMGGTWTIIFFFGVAVNTYSYLYILHLGASPSIVGLIAMVGAALLGISRLLGGYIADVHGRKRVIVVMTITLGFGNLLFAVAPDWRWILVATVVNSLALMYQPAISAIIADSIETGMRGRVMSIIRAVNNVAMIPAPMLSAYLVALHGLVGGMRILYAAQSAFLILSGILRAFLKETGGRISKSPGFLATYKAAFRYINSPYIHVIAVETLLMASLNISNPFIQIYVVKHLGLGKELWGYLNSLGLGVFVVFLPLSGWLTDKVNSHTVLILNGLTLIAGFTSLVFVRPSEYGVAMYLALRNLFDPQSALFSLNSKMVPPIVRGRVNALKGLIEMPVSGLGSLAGGLAYEALPEAPLMVSISIFLGYVLYTLLKVSKVEYGLKEIY